MCHAHLLCVKYLRMFSVHWFIESKQAADINLVGIILQLRTLSPREVKWLNQSNQVITPRFKPNSNHIAVGVSAALQSLSSQEGERSPHESLLWGTEQVCCWSLQNQHTSETVCECAVDNKYSNITARLSSFEPTDVVDATLSALLEDGCLHVWEATGEEGMDYLRCKWSTLLEL